MEPTMTLEKRYRADRATTPDPLVPHPMPQPGQPDPGQPHRPRPIRRPLPERDPLPNPVDRVGTPR